VISLPGVGSDIPPLYFGQMTRRWQCAALGLIAIALTAELRAAQTEQPKGVAVLQRVLAALKPGGRVVLCEPVPRTAKQARATQMEDHVLDPVLILEDLRAAGFQIVDRQDAFATNFGGTKFGFIVARRP